MIKNPQAGERVKLPNGTIGIVKQVQRERNDNGNGRVTVLVEPGNTWVTAWDLKRPVHKYIRKPPATAEELPEGQRRVYDAMQENPQASQASIAKLLGITPQGVSAHVKKIRKMQAGQGKQP